MSSRGILAVVACVLMASTVARSEEPGAEALKYFVGNWKAELTDKPSKLVPQGAKREVLQNIDWTLKKRFIIGREFRPSDGAKSLWLMTYDADSQSYPFWLFDNRSLLGAQWGGTWDHASRTWTGKSTDAPAGWTSQATSRFPDDKTDEMDAWMKNDSGELIFAAQGKKTRQPDSAATTTLALWNKAPSDAERPPESKPLDRLIGKWAATARSKVAEWTPGERQWTGKIVRTWVLDNHCLQDASENSLEDEGLSLTGYDPNASAYRNWWFDSEGHRTQASGQWDDATATFSYKSDLDGGLTARTTTHLIDNDHHDVHVLITDGGGKTYFDATWSVTRAKD